MYLKVIFEASCFTACRCRRVDDALQLTECAFYRELPELSRQYIMRVLFLEHALPLTMVSTWARTNPESQR